MCVCVRCLKRNNERRGGGHTCAADIFTLGVVLFVLFEWIEPLVWNAVSQQYYWTPTLQPQYMTDDAVALVMALLQPDPRDRLPLTGIHTHHHSSSSTRNGRAGLPARSLPSSLSTFTFTMMSGCISARVPVRVRVCAF